ncbi:MAG: PAS domain S-box protein [Ignavibacteriaceae bacterium]
MLIDVWNFVEESNSINDVLNNSGIDINSGNPTESILSPHLNPILTEIRILYPFTVSGKARVRKVIDQFDECIYLKNKAGNLLIVNSSYASSFGVSAEQIEGKTETEFLPSPVAEILSSVDKYICESLNYIRIDGVPLIPSSNISEQEFIEIPITDHQNKVMVLLGITQKKVKLTNYKFPESSDVSGQIIENFAKPVALIDEKGLVLYANKKFCNLVLSQTGQIKGVHFTDVLSTELSETVKIFLNGESSSHIFSADEQFQIIDSENSKYKIYLSKIISPGIETGGVIIFIDEEQTIVDLGQLISRRGRMFDILIQNNPEPIIIYDIDNLRFLEVNEAALHLYGYSRDEFLQMDLTDLYTPEDIQTLLGSSSDEADSSEFKGPYRHRIKNGESIFVEISRTRFQYNGKDSFFNIVRNISARIELEKKNQLFKAAFDNTNDIIIISDINGFINFINKSGMELLGYSSSEISNTSFAALVKDEHRSMINTSVFSSDVKENVSLELDIKKNDGTFLSSEVNFTPIIDYEGKVDSFTILLKPVKQEREIRDEKVIKEVMIEKKPSEEVNLLDSNFLSGVFHEILTPMNVILGFAQELTDSINNPSADQKEASELINQNKIKLLSTMNSVVEYSEILQHKFKLNSSEVSITQIIDNLDKKIPELINNQDTEFSYGKISSSLVFSTDHQKFETLIASLIKVISRLIKDKKLYFSSYQLDDDNFLLLISDNFSKSSDYLTSKLKYIYYGNNDIKDIGTPKLSTHFSKTLLGMLGGKFIENEKFGGGFIFPMALSKDSLKTKFKSVDSSIEEILDKHKPDAFNPFGEEDTEDQVEEETTGIILDEPQEQSSIDSEITYKAENMMDQSTVDESFKKETDKTLEPVDDPGGTISGDLPLEKPDKESSDVELKKGKEFNLTDLTCLYIEDQIDSQILFKVQMKGLKEIKFAVSFEEALPLLESSTFDFIVMDINLQGEYNGLDALKIINKMPSHENTPIIAVTAYVLPGDKEKFIATGFNDFVSKPIFREKMVESLERVFSK